MPHFLRFCLVFLFLAVPARADVPKVATDIAPVHSLVAMVMRDIGAPDLIIDSAAGPHGGAMRPSQARALQGADLVIWIGPELSPWLEEPIATLAPNAKHLELLRAKGTHLLDPRARDGHDHGHDDHGHDDHGHDDDGHDDDGHDDDGHEDEGHVEDGYDNEAADPHAWLDPDNAVIWLGLIADILMQADPNRAGAYYMNAALAKQQITALTTEIEADIAPMRGQPFVTFHDAYQYFEARFGLTSAGAVTASDATNPGPAGLARLRDELNKAGVTCAFSEPQFDPGLLYAATGNDDLTIIPLDPLGLRHPPGPELYPALLRDMGRAFASCLGPD